MTETTNTATAEHEEQHYRLALRRIYTNIIWVSVAGTVIATLLGDTPWGLGFLVGATVSGVNFRWLHRLVDSVGPKGKRPGKFLGFFLSFRYLLFGAVGYVIVRYFKINVMAALVGLFVAVAAVLIEILFELLYVRT